MKKKSIGLFTLIVVLVVSLACAFGCGSSNKGNKPKPADEMANFIYTETETDCQITGIKNKNVKQIVVPARVTGIDAGAFKGCDLLESITLPFIGASKTANEGFDQVLGYIFGYTNNRKYANTTRQYIKEDEENSNIYYYYFIPSTLKSVTISGDITAVSAYAFNGCENLTNIMIPDEVTIIGDKAFKNCENIKAVNITDNVTSIGRAAFMGCKSLENFHIPKALTIIEGLTFKGCSSLTSVVIPDGVTSIGDDAFMDCIKLTSITIGRGLQSIGNFAFDTCTKLVEVINNSQLEIKADNSDYRDLCENAIEIRKGGTSKIVKSGDYLFYPYNDVNYLFDYVGSNKNLTLPKNFNGQKYEIYKYAFFNREDIKSVTISDGVTSIGESAFSYSENLVNVTISDGVTNIGKRAFSCCKSLTNITVPDSVTSIGENAFYCCVNLVTATIGSGVESIEGNLFYECKKLVEIINKSQLKVWKEDATLNIKSEGKTDLINKNGYLFYIYDNVNYLVGYIGSDTQLVLPKNFNGQNYEIYRNAFIYDENIESVVIPDSVTNIGASAFEGCINITTIVIPDSVKTIEPRAFYECRRLVSVTLGKGLTGIDIAAFGMCEKLSVVINNSDLVIEKESSDYGGVGYRAIDIKNGESGGLINKDGYLFCVGDEASCLVAYVGNDKDLILPQSLNGQKYEIYKYAFRNNTKIESVVFSSGVTSIGEHAFSGCVNLKTVKVSNSITNISENAFYNCDKLSNIHIDDIAAWCNIEGLANLTNTEYFKTFYYDGKVLTNLVIPDGVTSIAEFAFGGNVCITSVIIPDSVETIMRSAFCECMVLVNVTIGKGLKTIDSGAFAGSSCLTNINIPDGLIEIGYGAFSQCDSIKTTQFNNAVYLGNDNNPYYALLSVEDKTINTCEINPQCVLIAASTFYNSKLTQITIPESVKYIGNNAFSSCTGLTSVSFGNNVEIIGESAFYSCTGLKSLVLPKNLKTIKYNAFGRCENITSVEFFDKLEILGNSAFSDCGSIESIVLPEGVKTIGNNAFDNCKGLTSIVIPKSVTDIGNGAFYGCWSLESIDIPKGITEVKNSTFSVCSSIASVVVPNGVTRIGDMAFSRCNSLTTIEIPSTVKSIGTWAFWCQNLSTINYKGTIEQWKEITKDDEWLLTNKKDLVVHCDNGDLTLNEALS